MLIRRREKLMHVNDFKVHIYEKKCNFSHFSLEAEDCDQETDCYCDAQTHHH